VSADIDLYEDDRIGISATLGGWGVRLSVDQKCREPECPTAAGLMGDLLTREKLEALIAGLGRVKDHLDLLAEDAG
jgi:hypothetical protein